MFSKETLQLIIAQAIAANGAPETNTPLALLPGDVKLVSLEQYEAGRSRFRGALSTNSLHDFSDYVIGRNGPAAKGFVDQDAMSCRVFFNLGTELVPGHADDTATLQLKPTAAYKALRALAGEPQTQKELAEWMEDWHPQLTATDTAGNALSIVKAIAAVRNITIKASAERNHAEGNFSNNTSSMDAIEAASQDTLPAALHFSIVPYDGLAVRVFTLRLSVLTSADKPTLKPRWVGEEQQREEIAQEFKGVLAKEVGGSAILTLGSFNPGN